MPRYRVEVVEIHKGYATVDSASEYEAIEHVESCSDVEIEWSEEYDREFRASKVVEESTHK